MGEGIDRAKLNAPEHAKAMEDMRDQLLIVFLKRLGGKAVIPCAEIDATGGLVLAMRIDENRVFTFSLSRQH